MSNINLKIAVWKEEKHYVAQCLNIDVSSFGKTKKVAIANLEEALALYLEDTNTHQFTKVERPDVVSLRLQYA